jgi:hypothetical protein
MMGNVTLLDRLAYWAAARELPIPVMQLLQDAHDCIVSLVRDSVQLRDLSARQADIDGRLTLLEGQIEALIERVQANDRRPH